MVRFYNDIGEFHKPSCKVKTRVNSNLCTYYYRDKKRFCGNYCSRKINKFNNKCWRHKLVGPQRPGVVLLMISSSGSFYNRDLWMRFLCNCEEQDANIHMVIYHKDMLNCTVRQPNNLLSRYRPFPDIFGKVLETDHGGVNYTQIYFKMLEYGCKIPNATRCVVLTERTIPIRSPNTIYRTALNSKCNICVSFNVAFTAPPPNLPIGQRGKPYAAVNNAAQGLFTVDFLKEALPTVPLHCSKFGITLNKGVYTVTDEELLNKWREYTSANLDEFWLLNSYLMHHFNDKRPLNKLKHYLELTKISDGYTIAEVPEWRNDTKRTFIFKNLTSCVHIPKSDFFKTYYKGLNTKTSLLDVLRYVRKNKKRALFFRQVELPY